jgi:predicted transcriptional regulator of viral defense system
VQVSDLEKTLVDGAAQPHLCGGIAELAKGLWLRKDDLDESRLVIYLKRMNHKAAAKCLGFLLEIYSLGRPETTLALQSFINQRYAFLDPTLPDNPLFTHAPPVMDANPLKVGDVSLRTEGAEFHCHRN